MQIHELKRKNKNKKDRIVGRGGKHAKTSGRGGKGQTARAGNKRRPALRDIIKKLPKKRGYSFSSRKVDVQVNSEKVLASDGKQTKKFSEIRKELGLKGGKIQIRKAK